LDRGAAVCITTHYERLKSLAASDARLCNAAAGFDREHLRPTFRIEYGAPGASSALLVAQRYGIDPAVLARAESLLPEGVIDQRALARQLDEQRVRLETTTAEVELERRKAAQLARDLERERARRERRRAVRGHRRQAAPCHGRARARASRATRPPALARPGAGRQRHAHGP